jgi:hypothetical protein
MTFWLQLDQIFTITTLLINLRSDFPSHIKRELISICKHVFVLILVETSTLINRDMPKQLFDITFHMLIQFLQIKMLSSIGELSNHKWTKEDNSLLLDKMKTMEIEHNLRYIEAVGSLNYLCNTFPQGLYTIRKLCKFMNLPGAKHFCCLIHFLHHIQCHPPGAFIYYHDVKLSPLYTLLRDAGHADKDPSIVWFSNSSHNDCDDQRSTACHLGFDQGGLVDFSSFVPLPIPMSSAESESNALCVASMAASHMQQAYSNIVFNDSLYTYTIPIYIDNTATKAMTMNDRDTKQTKHIEEHYFIDHIAKLD